MQPHWAPWRVAACARPLPPGPERRIAEGNLDNQLMGCCIVTPYSPPVEPRARRTHSPMMVMPPFFDFLATQKIIENSIPQKINFFAIFGDFWRFCDNFFRILGLFWDPPGVIFRLFWQMNFSAIFFINFLKKIKNSKNEKVAFVS